MPPRTWATMGMDTSASNDDIEYKPATTPGSPDPTTTDTLIQMMMEYLKKQDEYLKKQDECLKRMNEYLDRRMGKSLQKSAENSDSLSRKDQEDIKQEEDEMKLTVQVTVTTPPSTKESSEEPTIKEPSIRTTMMRLVIKNTTTTTTTTTITAIKESLKHQYYYHKPKPHRCRKGEG
ncbi:hypothetical protein I7I48_03146 [Histoplasma ohiense]|nr:hypothetical protein I7I48_03146 [Histoplasma ohiense (nom. inval.)]